MKTPAQNEDRRGSAAALKVHKVFETEVNNQV